MRTPDIYPVVLAAGPSPRLRFLKALAQLGGRNAFEIAVENCAGLQQPIVVLGYQAARLRRHVPPAARIVIHRAWRAGQLSSLRAGLRRVPSTAAFMLYPVDLVFLTPPLIHRLVRAFEQRKKGQEILMPRFRGRAGHPAILSAKVREDLRHASTAREVVYRDLRRVVFIPVRSAAIWRDLGTSAAHSRSARKYRKSKQ
jgi:CTP:molybdopterin cytidylyltransferase MocA